MPDYGDLAILSQKKTSKTSATIKVDKTISEKEPTLTLIEILRILDARNEDMGLNKQVNTD